MANQKCDFCAAVDPEWVYSAKSFEVDLVGEIGESVGAWTACDTCSNLIERDERMALTERSLGLGPSASMPLTNAQRQILKDKVLEMHAAFFNSRTGARRKFG